MIFSYGDYIDLKRNRLLSPPIAFRPYISIDKSEYKKLEKFHEKNHKSIGNSFDELKKRVPKNYFWKVYPVQSQVLDYSQISFPSYRFILPEILADDWLGIVDWHKFQRDHALHQPLTSYIIIKLLKGGGEKNPAFGFSGKSLLEESVEILLNSKKTNYLRNYLKSLFQNKKNYQIWLEDSPKTKSLWRALFFETAYISSVFHDIGYPWQYVNLLNSKLDLANCKLSNIWYSISDFVENLKNRLVMYPFNGYEPLSKVAPLDWKQKLERLIHSSLNRTHGLPGAINFLYLNDVMKKYPDRNISPIKQFCLDWAAMAIMMHDMCNIYWDNEKEPKNQQLRLDFETDPLSCVLTLADLLQEFCRPNVRFHSDVNNRVKMEYQSKCNFSQLENDEMNRTLYLEYFYDNQMYYIEKRKYLDGERYKYFDNNFGYIDLSYLGIEKVNMKAYYL